MGPMARESRASSRPAPAVVVGIAAGSARGPGPGLGRVSRSAAWNSSAVWKRWPGSLASARMMAAETACGTSGLTVAGSGGMTLNCAFMRACSVFALNGAAAGDHFVKREAQRVDVGTGVGLTGADLLGRHIGEGSHGQAGAGEARPAGGARDAEIGELDDAAGGDQDVGGLDIAVNHAALVRERQRRQDLVDVTDGRRDLDRPVAQRLFQADAFHQFQDHDQAVFDAQGGVERRDVGMLEAGVDFDLAQKAVGQRGVLVQIGEDDLHGLLAVREQAAHAEDLAHAAAAQNAGDLIIAEDIADLNGHY